MLVGLGVLAVRSANATPEAAFAEGSR
jgi:hypothetical protein